MSNSRRTLTRHAVWAGCAAVATALLYLAFLGWHALKDTTAGGRCVGTGPYEAWQVVGLGVGLVVIACVAAWRGHPWPVVGSCVPTLTTLWAVDAATVHDPCLVGANLWPVGAAFLFVGALVGLGASAALTVQVRLGVRRSRG